jgi:hypothetical protein
MSEYLARKLDTLLWCPRCQDSVLRSRKTTHDHTLIDSPPKNTNVTIEEDGSESYEHGGDEPMEVGGVYDVEIYWEYRVTKTVVAPTKSIAEDKVDIMTDGVLTHQLHSNTEKRESIYEDESRAEEHDLLP